MPFRATAAEVLGWRMRALGLTAPLPGSAAGDAPARVAAVASRMLAVQGQDWWGGRAALGLRAADATLQDVHAAFNAGAIVRSWPMRGTLHLLAAEDIGWMQASTNHRVLPGAPKRRATIGLTEASLDRMTELTIAALQGGRARSRAQLSDAWRDGGVAVQGPWRYHVIWWLAQTGVICFGTTADGGEPLAVLAAEWIPRPRSLDGDEARAELAVRYAAARGPVGVRDLSWWTGLTLREARAAVAAAASAGRLVPVFVGDTELWAPPEAVEDRAVSPAGVWLLPPFDEHLLGYTDRGLLVDPAHAGLLVPGKNGVFGATVVRDGRVVALWKREPLRDAVRLRVTPLPGEALASEELAAPVARLGQFLGAEVVAELPG